MSIKARQLGEASRTRSTSRVLPKQNLGGGRYLVSGYLIRRAGSAKALRWLVDDPAGKRVGQRTTLTAAEQLVGEQLKAATKM